MRERGYKTFADGQRDGENCRVTEEKRWHKKREDLRNWVTLSCCRGCQLKWCCWPQLTVLRGETNTQKERQTSCCSHELILHQPPELAQLSPKAFWEKGKEDRRLPSSHSNSCGDVAVHKLYYRPIWKIDTRFVFYSKRKTAAMSVASASFQFALKSLRWAIRWRFNRPSHAGNTACYWPNCEVDIWHFYSERQHKGNGQKLHKVSSSHFKLSCNDKWKMITDNGITKQGKCPIKSSEGKVIFI